MSLPRDDLAGHFVPRVGKVSCETEVSNFELAVGGDEQIVRFKVLHILSLGISSRRVLVTGVPGVRSNFYGRIQALGRSWLASS